MNINEMDLEQVELRMNEVKDLLHNDDADLDALEQEITELRARRETIMSDIESRKAEIDEVIKTATKVTDVTERTNMENIEVRNTKEYINAYANYIKTGDDRACRTLLSENVGSGTVAVPDMVYDIVKNAWDREDLMSLVRKTYVKGNLKVQFERSSDGAQVHREGDDAIDEENLLLGIARLDAVSIKKWVGISDEALDMGGEQFLRYVYDEITYQIAHTASAELLQIIEGSPETSDASSPAVGLVEADTITLDIIAQALAKLSDQATNPVVVMNRGTWGAIKAVQYNAQYAVDPFEGCRVVFNSTLPSFATATAGEAYIIVGDFANGAMANFPNGEEITLKFDDLTYATSDIVRIIGRQYVGLGVVAPNHFCQIAKSTSGE